MSASVPKANNNRMPDLQGPNLALCEWTYSGRLILFLYTGWEGDICLEGAQKGREGPEDQLPFLGWRLVSY